MESNEVTLDFDYFLIFPNIDLFNLFRSSWNLNSGASRISQGRGVHLLCDKIFANNYTKMKKIGPRGGRH